ncbi:MAG: dihydrodipicolinate synthase family protein [Bifidobacterium aquikefiri]|nr:dihydrodipicolinate synthase family protein [Bifidobacterium aquikefiri]
MMRSHTSQIISAAIAIFDAHGDIAIDEFELYLLRLLPYVDGVLVNGTTAEFPSLSPYERTRLIQSALNVFDTSRVIAHIGAASLRQTSMLLNMAADVGATRFTAITPYYLHISEASTLHYYELLRKRTPGRLYAYIYPDVTGNDITAKTISRFADIGIDGLKLSGMASDRVAQYHHIAPHIDIWSGNDADFPNTISHGGAGVISGVSGVYPMAWSELRDAVMLSDKPRIAAIQQHIRNMVRVLGPSIGNIKYALRLLGIAAGQCRMPIDGVDESSMEKIRCIVSSESVDTLSFTR